MSKAVLVLGAGGAMCAAWGWVHAADTHAYPSRPLRFVVPFPPSGSNDIIARALATKLAGELRKIITADIAKWAKVVRDAGIQPE